MSSFVCCLLYYVYICHNRFLHHYHPYMILYPVFTPHLLSTPNLTKTSIQQEFELDYILTRIHPPHPIITHYVVVFVNCLASSRQRPVCTTVQSHTSQCSYSACLSGQVCYLKTKGIFHHFALDPVWNFIEFQNHFER